MIDFTTQTLQLVPEGSGGGRDEASSVPRSMKVYSKSFDRSTARWPHMLRRKRVLCIQAIFVSASKMDDGPNILIWTTIVLRVRSDCSFTEELVGLIVL